MTHPEPMNIGPRGRAIRLVGGILLLAGTGAAIVVLDRLGLRPGFRLLCFPGFALGVLTVLEARGGI